MQNLFFETLIFFKKAIIKELMLRYENIHQYLVDNNNRKLTKLRKYNYKIIKT
jgi:hypothetical protein